MNTESSSRCKKKRALRGKKGHGFLACNVNPRQVLWCNLRSVLEIVLAYIARLAVVETTAAVVKMVVRLDSTALVVTVNCCTFADLLRSDAIIAC